MLYYKCDKLIVVILIFIHFTRKREGVYCLKILVTETIWDEGIEGLKQQRFSIYYDQILSQEREKLLSIISEYDGLIIRNQTNVDKELLQKGTNLKVIGRLGVGLDNVDTNEARKQGIKVVAAKHANATSVAEYVMAVMLDAYRSISEAPLDVRKGNWNRKLFTGSELNGKTLGLFGLGEIAHRVAKRANVFGMNVIGFDSFITPYDHVLSETGVHRVNKLEELLSESDFISIHVPLTQSTEDILNLTSFSKMKSGSYVINTARGGIVNEKDLCQAVKKGVIAGAYLDVIEAEPVEKNAEMLSIDKIHITPHIAGLTDESQQRTSMLVAQEVTNVLKGKKSLCAVN